MALLVKPPFASYHATAGQLWGAPCLFVFSPIIQHLGQHFRDATPALKAKGVRSQVPEDRGRDEEGPVPRGKRVGKTAI